MELFAYNNKNAALIKKKEQGFSENTPITFEKLRSFSVVSSWKNSFE